MATSLLRAVRRVYGYQFLIQLLLLYKGVFVVFGRGVLYYSAISRARIDHEFVEGTVKNFSGIRYLYNAQDRYQPLILFSNEIAKILNATLLYRQLEGVSFKTAAYPTIDAFLPNSYVYSKLSPWWQQKMNGKTLDAHPQVDTIPVKFGYCDAPAYESSRLKAFLHSIWVPLSKPSWIALTALSLAIVVLQKVWLGRVKNIKPFSAPGRLAVALLSPTLGGCVIPKKHAVLTLWLFGSMILSIYYVGRLSTELSLPMPPHVISDINELHRNNLEILMKNYFLA